MKYAICVLLTSLLISQGAYAQTDGYNCTKTDDSYRSFTLKCEKDYSSGDSSRETKVVLAILLAYAISHGLSDSGEETFVSESWVLGEGGFTFVSRKTGNKVVFNPLLLKPTHQFTQFAGSNREWSPVMELRFEF